MSTTPEWHEDPTAPGSGRQRYWDGAQWTEWVMDPGATEARAYPVAEAQAAAAVGEAAGAVPPESDTAQPGEQVDANGQMQPTEPIPPVETQPTAAMPVMDPAGGAPQAAPYANQPMSASTVPVGVQPAKKSKAPLIIGIVVGVILLFIVGGIILAAVAVNKVTDDVSDALDDLAASASAEVDDWESWAADITEEAEALEEEFGDVTADPTASASLDAWFPDDDDPEAIYLWIVELFETGLEDDEALEAGYWVCEQFEAGAGDSTESMNQLLVDTAERYSLDEWAAAGIMSSATELCPDYTDALDAWGS